MPSPPPESPVSREQATEVADCLDPEELAEVWAEVDRRAAQERLVRAVRDGRARPPGRLTLVRR